MEWQSQNQQSDHFVHGSDQHYSIPGLVQCSYTIHSRRFGFDIKTKCAKTNYVQQRKIIKGIKVLSFHWCWV